jgi:hypothetical protein
MTATRKVLQFPAEIRIGSRRIISCRLSPLVRYNQEVLRER